MLVVVGVVYECMVRFNNICGVVCEVNIRVQLNRSGGNEFMGSWVKIMQSCVLCLNLYLDFCEMNIPLSGIQPLAAVFLRESSNNIHHVAITVRFRATNPTLACAISRKTVVSNK